MFGTQGKKERALGINLGLKPFRSNSPKGVMVRRPHRPGLHGKRRRTMSEFGQQLTEKQKIRFSYGVREAQLKNLFREASKHAGVTGEMLMRFLELRLDNVVYRLGFAPSRSVARQLVGHGHIIVNGRKVTIPSFRVKENDLVAIRPQSATIAQFKDIGERLKQYQAPVWLTLTKIEGGPEGKVVGMPKDFDIPFDLSRVVDYYSK